MKFSGLIFAGIALCMISTAVFANEGDIVVEGKQVHRKIKRMDSAIDYLREDGRTMRVRTLDFSVANESQPVRTLTRWKGGIGRGVEWHDGDRQLDQAAVANAMVP
jgi:hypothetical protein